jgi:hypothetical protein
MKGCDIMTSEVLENKVEFNEMNEGIRFFVSEKGISSVDSTIALGWCVDKRILEMLRRVGERYPLLVLSVNNIDGSYVREVSRKVVPLEQAIEFVQFSRPGKHEIIGTIVYHPDVFIWQLKKYFLNRYSRRGSFDKSIVRENWDTSGDEPFVNLGFRSFTDFLGYGSISRIGFGSLSVNVDKEFFAKEPPDWLKKWTNFWFRYDPVDECAFRARLIHSFTWKPFAFALWFMVKELFVLFAGIVLLFSGFREVSFIPFWHPLKYPTEQLWWNVRGTLFVSWKRPYLVFLFPPLVLLLMALLIVFGRWFGFACWPSIFICFFSITIACFSTFIIVKIVALLKGLEYRPIWFAKVTKVGSKGRKRRVTKAEKRKRKKEVLLLARYKEFDSLICCESGKRDFTPELKNLPSKRRTFRLRFWNLKARVCKPFAR